MPFSDARECAIMRDILLILIKFSIAAVLFLIVVANLLVRSGVIIYTGCVRHCAISIFPKLCWSAQFNFAHFFHLDITR